jgi:hypothetical protein
MEIDDIQRIETPKNPGFNDPNNDINSTNVMSNDTPQGKSNFSF